MFTKRFLSFESASQRVTPIYKYLLPKSRPLTRNQCTNYLLRPGNYRAMSGETSRKIPMIHYDCVIKEVINAHKVATEQGASPEIIAAIEKALDLAQRKDDFTESLTNKDSVGCARLLAESFNHDWEGAFSQGKTSSKLVPGMVSGTLEGQFLKSFVSVQRAKKVLEVGMFTGFGALSLAEGLPADGQVVTIDNKPYLEQVVRPLLDQFPHGNKVKIAIGDACEKMRELLKAGEKFDVVFLDADKSLYKECLEICFVEGLLSPNGTVLVDNAFQHGRAFNPEAGQTVAKEFAAHVAVQKDLHKVVIPMRDGVYMIRRLSDVEGSV